MMHNAEELLLTMSEDLPLVLRQLQSDDPLIATAGYMRLQELERMAKNWRFRRVSRRGLMRVGVGATFAAMSVNRDD